jgi:hypothetical protein
MAADCGHLLNPEQDDDPPYEMSRHRFQGRPARRVRPHPYPFPSPIAVIQIRTASTRSGATSCTIEPVPVLSLGPTLSTN